MWLLVSLDVINCLGFGWCHFYLLLIWIRWVISQIFVPTQLVTCCATKDDAVRFFSQTMFTPAALIGSAALGLLFLPPAKFAFCDPQQQPYRIFQFLYRATWISTGETSWAVIGMILQRHLYHSGPMEEITCPKVPGRIWRQSTNSIKKMADGDWLVDNTRFLVHKKPEVFASSRHSSPRITLFLLQAKKRNNHQETSFQMMLRSMWF